MLSTIREKTQGIIASFIMLLIVIPFALWGINSYFDKGSKVDVAKVDGVDISQSTYRHTLDQLRGRVDPKAFDTPAFKRMILDSLIDQTLLIHDAENQGYRVSDARLAQMIREAPYFQRDGKFDATMYEAVLRREGMSTHDFETRLRGDNLSGQVQVGLSESGIVTEAEISQLAKLMSQEREVAYVVISPETFLNKVSVSEQAIKEYYSAKTDMFQTPEQVRVEYLRLSASDLNQGLQPTEEELKKAYAEEAGRFVVPAVRRASHILLALPTQASPEEAKQVLTKMQDIAKQAQKGADFSSLAKKYSADTATAARGGDLGEIRPGVLPKELEQAVLSLQKTGAISQPVRTTYGYHLLKLTTYTPEKRKSFAEARKELIEAVRRRRGEEKFFEVTEKFRNLIYEQPDSLAPAAKALGLQVQKSDWFTRAGGAGIAASPKVAQAAFEPDVLSQARNSDAIEVNNDTLVAIHVIERKPAGHKSLDEVRPQIQRILQQQQAQQDARKLGETWLTELRAGAALDSLAKKRNIKYQAPKMLTRQQTAGADPRLVEAAFRAPRPENGKTVYDLVDLGNQGYAVIALKNVRDPSKFETSAQEKATRLLVPRRGADYYANYKTGLRQKTKIKIFDDQL